jgi:hypothetical protein
MSMAAPRDRDRWHARPINGPRPAGRARTRDGRRAATTPSHGDVFTTSPFFI